MKNKVFVEISLFLLILIISSAAYAARYTYSYERGYSNINSSNTRDAAYLDDWTERGDAQITESSLFFDGIRLEANGTKEEPAMAAAIYRFSAPSLANSLKIKVYYKDVSRDDEIAAQLFVRTKNEFGREEDGKTRYGDTFVLRSDRLSETIYLSAERYIIDNFVEVHIVAQNKDVIEVKKIKLESVSEKPEIRVIKKYYTTDYWREYPRHRYIYHYYYYGPYYWPSGYRVYVRWAWPDYYYWEVWRPSYTRYVKVYVRRPHWYRSYVTIYDDPPSAPTSRAVRARRRRVSRSIVTRSRRRLSSSLSAPGKQSDSNTQRHISSRSGLKRRRRKNPDLRGTIQRNRSRTTSLKRRDNSGRPQIKTTIRRNESNRTYSLRSSSRSKSLLGRIVSFFSSGRHQTKQRRSSRFHRSSSSNERRIPLKTRRSSRTPSGSSVSFSSSNRSSRTSSSNSHRVRRKHHRRSSSNDDDDDDQRRRKKRRRKR